VKHYSIRTEAQYVNWIKRYIYFHDKRHPRDMGAQEVEAFVTDLDVNGGVSATRPIRAAVRCAVITSTKSCCSGR
jgi:hypothetical protein